MAAANNPANSLRLPPGDLRRRLTTGPAGPAPAESESLPAPATSHRLTDLRSRLHTPESVGRDLPANDAKSDCARVTPLPRGLSENNVLRRPEPAAQEGSILSELFRTQEPSSFRPAAPVPPAYAAPAHAAEGDHDDGDLAAENAQLRQMIQETRLMLEDAAAAESDALARETEYQRLVEDLNRQIVEMREQAHSASPARQEDDLEEWANEIEKDSARLAQERKAHDTERSQLREDEASLEQQMRTMEVQMARERAVMARQETELKRLSSDIQHELEMMSRGDAALRDQLQKFQRRHQEVLSRGAGGPPPQHAPQAPMMTPAPPASRPMPGTGSQPISHTPASGQAPGGPNGSGLLRRLFRPRNEE